MVLKKNLRKIFLNKLIIICIFFFSIKLLASDKDYCLYSQALKLNNEAADFQYKYENSMTDKKFSQLMDMREDIFNLSKRINIEALSDYHKDLPFIFEKFFVSGQNLQVYGWQKQDSESIYRGQVLLNEFGGWFNQKKIKYPKVKKSYCKKVIKN